MRIPHSQSLRRELNIPMTPMIDVVFLLLIFFVCTASFQVAESVLVTPLLGAANSTTATAPPPLERVVIRVLMESGNLQLTVNDVRCRSLAHLSILLTALARVDHSLPVLLDVADEVLVDTTIDVYDRCRLAGYSVVQFVVEAPP